MLTGRLSTNTYMAPFPVSRTEFPQQPLLCGILHPLELSGGFYGPPGSEQGGAEVPTGEAPGGYASKLSTRQTGFYDASTACLRILMQGWSGAGESFATAPQRSLS